MVLQSFWWAHFQVATEWIPQSDLCFCLWSVSFPRLRWFYECVNFGLANSSLYFKKQKLCLAALFFFFFSSRQGYPEGYYNSKSGWSSQSDYYANYYSSQYDYGGMFRHCSHYQGTIQPLPVIMQSCTSHGLAGDSSSLFLSLACVFIPRAKVIENS